MKSVSLFVFLLSMCDCEYFSYSGYKVYQIRPQTPNQYSALRKLEENGGIDFFSSSDVMVAPHSQEVFIDLLRKSAIPFEVKVPDVKEVVENERRSLEFERLSRQRGFNLTDYNLLENIYSYLHELQDNYSEIVRLEKIGKTYENREIFLLRISSNLGATETENRTKPGIFIDAGIHAREWLAPAVALYIVNQLVENPTNRHLIQDVDWYIIPVLNPDGYVYTHTKNRYWRKNRAPCYIWWCPCYYGVDLDRNFESHWAQYGSSFFCSSELYHGKRPFSENETIALRDTLLANSENIKVYLSFHSYLQAILTPYSFSCYGPEDYEDLYELGLNVSEAISSVNGNKYTVGKSFKELGYYATGVSVDWVKDVVGIKYTYSFLLPPKTWYEGGFAPREDLIAPTGEEIFAGMKYLHDFVKDLVDL